MTLVIEENTLTAEQFQSIREATGRKPLPISQIRSALDFGLFRVLAKYNGRPVGMGRLVGDGSMYWYIQDLFVIPEYQGQGIGKAIVEYLIRHINITSPSGITTTVGLFSAIGKDGFYEKLGFTARPSEVYGAGMIKHLDIK